MIGAEILIHRDGPAASGMFDRACERECERAIRIPLPPRRTLNRPTRRAISVDGMRSARSRLLEVRLARENCTGDAVPPLFGRAETVTSLITKLPFRLARDHRRQAEGSVSASIRIA